jgi:hypothetical protein
MVLLNAVAAVQPGDVLDCVGTGTWQTGRNQQRYRAPILSSGVALWECVITSRQMARR